MNEQEPSTAKVLLWSPLWLLSLASLVASPIGIAYLTGWFIPGFEQVMLMAIGCLPFILAIALAADRVVGRHPYTDRDYRNWLAQTPWSYGDPLPKGSFHPKWLDIITLVFLAGYAYLCFTLAGDLEVEAVIPLAPWMACPAVFALAILTYLICLYSTISEDPATTRLVMVLIPLCVYPHLNPWIGISVIGLIYLVILIGVRRTLGRFPWNRRDWTESPRETFLRNLSQSGLLGWPYRPIGPALPKSPRFTPSRALACSLVGAWWVFASAHLGEMFFINTLDAAGLSLSDLNDSNQHAGIDPDRALRVLKWIFLGFTALLAASRLTDALTEARAPINLAGRFATRRLILPGYDVIFLPPAVIILLVWGLTEVLWYLRPTPYALMPAACTFVLLLLVTYPSPWRETWRYTGHFSPRNRGGPGQSEQAQRRREAQIQIKLPSCN